MTDVSIAVVPDLDLRSPPLKDEKFSQKSAENVNLDENKDSARRISEHCANFRGAIPKTAYTQLFVTLGLFLLCVGAMLATVRNHYWLTLILSLPAAGLLVRLFIIQHDCGHGSFLKTASANNIIGRLISVLTMTPYGVWRRQHAIHHATSGNLDKRGVGDITTLTVREYKALSPLAKLKYRIYRNPIFLFGFGVPLFFLLLQRFPFAHGLTLKDTWRSILGLNLALLCFYGGLIYLYGWSDILFVAWPILHLTTAAGGWLFFIQHQFEDAHWEQSGDWDFQVAAIHGSSYYKLPPILSWFSGNIGLHHIHHLNSMIPNYRLSECLEASEELQNINRITLFESFACANFKLFDEEKNKMIGFGDIR